ncbi:Calmodulin-binding [Carpediemonas membranifera]|uniref:Calmodulin-binding n=1 Tax=Carpediemonas membranifera TaxID=201153 RepID=A0A8J6BYJ6_9EUKA|nr:Calmodulin-binding [Carpediemonas membranifera]|eukprot:KAG9394566.1 Calmodulin-binding [Carpediemonas membranifera]
MAESVYNYATTDDVAAPAKKGKLYKSIYPKTLPDEQKGTFVTKKGSKMGSFGPASVKKAAADEFLKSGSGMLANKTGHIALPEPSQFRYNDPVPRRDPVPKKDERPIHGLKTSKNFINANAVEVICSSAKQPMTQTEKFENWTQKPDFGKVPNYLNRVKTEVEEEYKMVETMRQEANPASRSNVVEMPEEERQQLLAALRERWQKVDGEFQLTSFVLDTDSSKRKYEGLAKELQQLEKDIEMLEKGKVVVRV